ncbi:MAG: sulfotransferase [Oceanospirillaceae bacterium]|nr:sulfotransferase [Oceanospirillaceae bacterium]
MKDSIVSLDPNDLIAEAEAATGLADFGDWPFREALAQLLQSLDTEAGLTTAGRAVHRQRIVDILRTRLRFEAYLKRHPEILDERIGAPVFILGLPRTGTTLLQRLLAADPRFHSAAFWETRFPVPFEELDFADPADPRIDTTRAEVAGMLAAVPELASIHPLEAEAADEEITLLEQSFYSTNPLASANVPGFGAWVESQDQTGGYRYLKQLLQFLQWQKRQRGIEAERWVLKSPHHIHHLEVLLKVFPDARVIQTHRDPLQTIPSLASFVHTLRRLTSDSCRAEAAGEQWSLKMARGLAHCLAVRDGASPDVFLDIAFEETVGDPMRVLEKVYAFLGTPLTDGALAAIARWRAANPREKRAPHHYSLAQFGLSEAQIARDFAQYRERYGFAR